MKEYQFSVDFNKAYEKLRKKFLKMAKKNPGIFTDTHFVTQAKSYILEEFPLEHYGEKIDGIVFEAWGLRSLLESAFSAGFKMGQDPQGWKAARKEVKKLGQMMEDYRMKLAKRSFHPPLVTPLKIEGDELIFKAATGLRDQEFKEYRCSVEEFKKEKKRLEKIAKKVLDPEF